MPVWTGPPACDCMKVSLCMILTIMTAAFVIIVLGMGMPTPAVYALSAVLAAPALITLGIAVLPAHLFIVYFASMSAITPPVAVAAFAAASIAQANPIKIAVLACRVAMVAFIIPFIFIFNPALLLQGSAVEIVSIAALSAFAVVALNAALEGYLFRKTDGLARVGLGVAGVLMLVPTILTQAVGGGLFLTLIVLLWTSRQSAAGRESPLTSA